MLKLIDMIQGKRGGFSKGQNKIADFIIDNYGRAAFMTAAQMAQLTNVSESTVVRFAVEIGFKGYPELQKVMREMVRSQLTAAARLELTNDIMGDKGILEKVIHSDLMRLRQTLDEIDADSFTKALEVILKAERIFIVGSRSSAMLAGFLGFYFRLVFDDVRVVDNMNVSGLYEHIYRVGREDAFIVISFPRYSQRTIKAAQYACDRGSAVIAITDSKTAPINQYARYVLEAKSDMASFADSLVAPLSVINALIVAVGMNKKEELGNTLEQLESMWDEYNVY